MRLKCNMHINPIHSYHDKLTADHILKKGALQMLVMLRHCQDLRLLVQLVCKQIYNSDSELQCILIIM